jgi:PHD/YefM family antitoxin component YafN of YafNO toxin-antitoxin module
MGVKILPSSTVRDKISSILKEFSEDDTPCFVTQYGKARAVLVDIHRYNAMMSLLEDIEDENDSMLAKRVEEARAEYSAGKGVPFKSRNRKGS